ncbi:sulfotransferase family protein [Roseomonas sp. BU-1]|uniref:Sulfotransferase family protein n=1 Tax=Falsiroseomonas selenitidurans TaxID=2716335 RepID=A0ABX1E275_9PROT|nr:sulfotransferase family protein [Falsiroseomonas selenitidurans]
MHSTQGLHFDGVALPDGAACRPLARQATGPWKERRTPVISIQHAFLFVHRGKSGGNSVAEALLPYSEDCKTVSGSQDGTERFDIRNDRFGTVKHARLRDYRQALPQALYAGLYKFATIRNPFERLVSAYFSPHRVAAGKVQGFDRAAFLDLVARQATLRDFIRTTPGGALDAELNRLMRFERLAEDFAAVTQAIGLGPLALPHRNRGAHAPYRAYYDADLRRCVEARSTRSWNGAATPSDPPARPSAAADHDGLTRRVILSPPSGGVIGHGTSAWGKCLGNLPHADGRRGAVRRHRRPGGLPAHSGDTGCRATQPAWHRSGVPCHAVAPGPHPAPGHAGPGAGGQSGDPLRLHLPAATRGA